MTLVTIAIPTRDAGPIFEQTLSAIAGQSLEGIETELLVCDSGSRDSTVALARDYGASVFEIAPEEFSHGATRNLLMERAGGENVAFLTQDAVPADELWLRRLLGGFAVAADVGLVFGPYEPRDDASLMVRRDLIQWFARFAPDGTPRIDRLGPHERGFPARDLLGVRGFFTDANGCVSRAAWDEVRFRPAAYAEDHLLAHDMLRAGFAKVFVPDAAVVHSHDYTEGEWMRRSFDEARALAEIYDFAELRGWRVLLHVWGLVRADLRFARREGVPVSWQLVTQSLRHHLARTTGTVLGGYAEQLPGPVLRRLSLEGRG